MNYELSAKTVKIEFNANLYLLGFPLHLRNAGKCLEVNENDTEELSNSMFLNVLTSSFFVIFEKLFQEELLGFPILGAAHPANWPSNVAMITVLWHWSTLCCAMDQDSST